MVGKVRSRIIKKNGVKSDNSTVQSTQQQVNTTRGHYMSDSIAIDCLPKSSP